MNSGTNLFSVLPTQKEAIDNINEHTLCIARSIIVRKRADGKYEILLAENSDGKRKGKKGKFEFLGGKVYDNKQDQEKFLSLNNQEREKAIIYGAIAEMGEEGGVFIPEHQINFLEVQNKDISGDPYRKHGMEIQNIQTHFYMCFLSEGEFNRINVECVEQASNDDNHKDVRWEIIDDINDIDDIHSLLGSNSHVNTKKLNTTLESTIITNQSKIYKILTQPGSELEEQGISPIDLSGRKEYIRGDNVDEQVTSLKNYYESQFGITLNSKEVNTNIKDVLSNYALPYIRNISQSLGIYSESEIQQLDRIAQAIPKISNSEGLLHFFKKYRKTRIGKSLIQRFFGFRHIRNLPYFSYIEGHLKYFQDELLSLCHEKDGKYIINNLSGKKVELSGLDSNAKALDRMASKITTKPYLNSQNIKDVYRARFIVEDEADVKTIQTLLLKKLGGSRSKKASSWQLTRKEGVTNINRDHTREEVKLLGRFPVYENGEYLKNTSIPLEIQIMTRSSYEKNESGANDHNVYREIQTLVDESRGNHPIPEATYLNIIQKLSNNEVIQSSYPHTRKGRNIQQRLYNDILSRFNKYFFETRDNTYIPYQHIYRYLNESHLVHKQNEYFMDMCKKMNILFNLNLTSLEWFILLNEREKDEKILDEIFSVSGRDFTNMFTQISDMKIGISEERIAYLSSI